MKAFADDKFYIAKMMTSVFDRVKKHCGKRTFFDRVKNIVGKGENAGYQHFLLFPKCFKKLSLSGLLKNSGLCDLELSPPVRNPLMAMGDWTARNMKVVNSHQP